MNTVKTFIATLSLVSTSLLQAATPVAIIEDIQASNTGLLFMDYVNEGQVIKLGKEESITLGYLLSCQRETITGGTVTIGEQQSKVSKGRLLREEVECSGGQAKLSGNKPAPVEPSHFVAVQRTNLMSPSMAPLQCSACTQPILRLPSNPLTVVARATPLRFMVIMSIWLIKIFPCHRVFTKRWLVTTVQSLRCTIVPNRARHRLLAVSLTSN